MKKLTGPFWVSLILIAAVVMSACRASSTPAPNIETKLKQEGELRVAQSGLGREMFNPLLTPGSNYVGYPIFDYLLGVDSDGRSWAPGLAESWQQAADGLSWTFKLRKGVEFHNGEELTAEDVRFSLLAYSQKLQGAPAVTSFYSARLKEMVKDVQVVDPFTVRVVTNEPEDFPTYVLPLVASDGAVMPKSYIERVGWEEFNRRPIGSGPWRLLEYKAGNYVKYEALPEHWRSTPDYKTLIVNAIPEENTRVAMLRTGEVDIAMIGVDTVKQVEQQQSLWVQRRPQEAFVSVWMVLDRSNTMPTAKVKVREALSLGIDRGEIAKYIGQGEATVPTYPLLVWNSVVTVDRKALPRVESDSEKAKRVLAEAGYAGGFSMDLWTAPANERLARTLADQWSKLGVKANVLSIDGSTQLSVLRVRPPDKKYQGSATVINVSGGGIPIWERLRTFYHSEGAMHLLDFPELDKMIDATVAEKDLAKRTAAVTQAVTFIHNQFISFPIYSPVSSYGMSKKIQSWENWEGSSLYEYATVRKAR